MNDAVERKIITVLSSHVEGWENRTDLLVEFSGFWQLPGVTSDDVVYVVLGKFADEYAGHPFLLSSDLWVKFWDCGGKIEDIQDNDKMVYFVRNMLKVFAIRVFVREAEKWELYRDLVAILIGEMESTQQLLRLAFRETESRGPKSSRAETGHAALARLFLNFELSK